MKIDFTVRSHRKPKAKAEAAAEEPVPGRPGRAVCLLALAHHFEQLLQTGAVEDYAGLARLGHVSRARITQIMNLLDLAPRIQERLLGMDRNAGAADWITERDLRRIVGEVRWDRQLAVFDGMISRC